MHCSEVHLQFSSIFAPLSLPSLIITPVNDRSIPPFRPRRRTAETAPLTIYKQMHVKTMTVAARSPALVCKCTSENYWAWVCSGWNFDLIPSIQKNSMLWVGACCLLSFFFFLSLMISWPTVTERQSFASYCSAPNEHSTSTVTYGWG